MATTLYGLKTCDTCRKARRWLDARGVTCIFVDLREARPDRERVARWIERLGWETLLNRHSRTWRELGDARPAQPDADSALALMLAHPALIKRPVMETDGTIHVGFDPARYGELFQAPGTRH